jgi:hypothetical protein
LKFSKSTINWVVAIVVSLGAANPSAAQLSPLLSNSALIKELEKPHMKLSVDAYYNAIRPTAGNDTSLVQVTLTLLFPP